jgi:hypothetical protein
MPAKYAAGTETPVSKSREEIERTLKRFGAHGFMYGDTGNVAAVMFEMKDRRYRIELRYPPESDFMSPRRTSLASLKVAREAEIKRLWRALLMVIKAKLEAVNSGITTVEDEFLGATVMANNQTVKQWIEPQIQEMYQSGQMPDFLPGIPPPGRKQIGPSDVIEGEVQEE